MSAGTPLFLKCLIALVMYVSGVWGGQCFLQEEGTHLLGSDLKWSLLQAGLRGKPSPRPLSIIFCHPQVSGPPPLPTEASADGPPREACREPASGLLDHVLGTAGPRENPLSLLFRGTGNRLRFLLFRRLGCSIRSGSFPPSHVVLGKRHMHMCCIFCTCFRRLIKLKQKSPVSVFIQRKPCGHFRDLPSNSFICTCIKT